MAINMMCMNTECKHYWEDNCIRNINEERIEIDESGMCVTFERGISELYNCEWSKDRKCTHPCSQGELDCIGTEEEKSKCMLYSEMEV